MQTGQATNLFTVDPVASRMGTWLYTTAALVFFMIIFGGLTRLTESGLSITEWKPITGSIPPLTDEDWEIEFAKYKNSPEYHKMNYGMTVDEFKKIFFMEWGHRELGRFIGCVYAAGLVWYGVVKGQLRGKQGMRLIGLLGLGGLQGAAGWFMVKSGLDPKTYDPNNTNEVPRVTAPRLATHLTLAMILYSALIWEGMKAKGIGQVINATPKGLLMWARSNVALTGLTAVSGAIVAGRDAGLVYKTWPTMDGEWVPSGLTEKQPLIRNWLENDATIQFTHRCLAYLTFLSVVSFTALNRKKIPHTGYQKSVGFLGVFAGLQVGLGITTLLAENPVPFAAGHQAGAMSLLTMSLIVLKLVARK